MIFNVELLSSQGNDFIRPVWVPDEAAALPVEELLEVIWRNGQNDFLHTLPREYQPVQRCSVSMGDVAEVNGEFWIAVTVGWKRLTPAELEEYKKLDRRDRIFSSYMER